MLSAAETSLSELSHHIQDLMGDDPLDYGPLGMEMEYHRVTEELADPKNLEHDQDPIEKVIQDKRSKLQIKDTQISSLNPVRDTTWGGTPAPDPDTAINLDHLPLYLLQHFSKWKHAIGDTNPPMTELLVYANDLANTSLGKLNVTGCISSPQAKHKGIQSPSQHSVTQRRRCKSSFTT